MTQPLQIDWDKFRVGTLVQMPPGPGTGLCIVEAMEIKESGDIRYHLDQPPGIDRREVRISLDLVTALEGEPAWSVTEEHMSPRKPLMFENRAYLLMSLQMWSRLSLDLVRAVWIDGEAGDSR